MRAHLSASRSPPTASLVLLNQQSQDLGLGQGHVGIHAEVIGTAMVLPAQIPAGRGTQGQWGRAGGAPVPTSPPRVAELPAAALSTPAHLAITRDQPRVFREVGPAWCRLGPAASKAPPNFKTQTLMQIPNSQDEGPELDNWYQTPRKPWYWGSTAHRQAPTVPRARANWLCLPGGGLGTGIKALIKIHDPNPAHCPVSCGS